MMDMLLELGGPSTVSKVTEADLIEVLNERPDYTNYWIQMSEDNRSTPAWFIRKAENGNAWEVSYYPRGDSAYFGNKIDACAYYIRNYLNQLCDSLR